MCINNTGIFICMDYFSWLVGIIEGEGCFTTKDSEGTPAFEVAMTDEDVIQKVAHLCNSNYRSFVPSGVSKNGEPYKRVYRVRFQGRKAVALMEHIYPYLSSRRQERIDQVRAAYSPKVSYKTEGYTPRPKKPIKFNF